MTPIIKELTVGTPEEFSPTAMAARARIATVIQKVARFTFGAIFAGLAIVAIAGLFKSSLAMTYGFILVGGGVGGSMAIDAILYQLMAGGILESKNSK